MFSLLTLFHQDHPAAPNMLKNGGVTQPALFRLGLDGTASPGFEPIGAKSVKACEAEASESGISMTRQGSTTDLTDVTTLQGTKKISPLDEAKSSTQKVPLGSFGRGYVSSQKEYQSKFEHRIHFDVH